MIAAAVIGALRVVSAEAIRLRISAVRVIQVPRTYNAYATDYFAELYTKD